MRHRIPCLPFSFLLVATSLIIPTACSRDASPTAPAKRLVAHVPSRAVGTTASGATLVTDKDDYSPGDTLKLSGTGWTPGDSLDVVLDESPQNHPPVMWVIGVGADGSFTDSTYVVQWSDAGVTFNITATSRATGETAQATFTDGSVTFNSSPVAVSSLKYAVTTSNSTCSGSPTFTSGTSPLTIGFSGNPSTYPQCVELRAPTSVTVASINYSFKQWTTTALLCSSNAVDTTQDVVGTEQRLEFVACGSGTTGTVTAVYETNSSPVLTITKTANNDAGCTDNTGDPDFCYNVQATYTITVSNAGPGATSGTVTVTDTLPSQLTYVNSTAGDWTCGAVLQIVTCTTSAVIAASGSKDLTLNVTPNTAANDVVNRASVQGGGDNTAASSSNAQVDIQGPNLTITKAGNNETACTDSVGDPDFCFGTQATYTITITNSGLAATSGTVTVTDTLPAQLTYVNSSVAGVWSCSATLQIVTCTTTDVIAAGGNKVLTLKVTPNTVANDVVNRASVKGGGDVTDASSANAQVDIKPAPTTSALTVAPSTQQYSDTTILADTITPYELLTSQLTGDVYFYVESAAKTCGTSAPSGSVGHVAIADADNGVAQFRYKIDSAPGAYKVTACFYSENGNFANSSDNKDLTVTKEDATVSSLAFSPDPVQVSSPGGTASATITFQVKETKPELNSNTALAGPGDLSKATIDVDLVAIGNGFNSQNNVSCSSSNGGTPNTYTSVLNVTCPVSGLAPDTYDVQVTVNNYYTGSGDIVMTVTDPSLGFATGGGWYTMDNGDRVNFGFEVKATVNNKKTVYQGSLLVIRHMGADVIKVKGNAFDGYAIQGNTVTFSGKATYSVDGTSIGNYAYTAYGEDNATSGAGADKFGLYLALSPNQVATSSTIGNLISNAKLLSAGNIQVPQPQGHK